MVAVIVTLTLLWGAFCHLQNFVHAQDTDQCNNTPHSYWDGMRCVCDNGYYQDELTDICEVCSPCCSDDDIIQICINQEQKINKCRKVRNCPTEMPYNSTSIRPEKEDLSTGVIVGIVCGVIIGLFVCAGLAIIGIYCCRTRNINKCCEKRLRVPQQEETGREAVS
ncbi:uncharacterized protein LOC144439459 [Glandiceps talaboti]